MSSSARSSSGNSPKSDTSNGLLVQEIVTEEALIALEPEWRRLEARILQLPFVHFDWILPWWRHLSAQKQSVRDEMFVLAFRLPNGELLGIAPLMITVRPNIGPLRFRQLQFFGTDPNITEIRGIAAAPADMSRLYTALMAYIAGRPPRWDSIQLAGMPSDDAQLAARIDSAFGPPACSSDTVNPILLLKPTWEEFRSALPRNIKESLRKCYNAPKRDGLSFDFQVVREPRGVDAALHAFFELHRRRSKMPGTIGHSDNFGAPRFQDFLSDVCHQFAQRGALRIFQLRNNEAVIATRIGFALRDMLYLYYSGYDPEYQKYSVMTTTVAESIKYAIANGFNAVNLSTGRDVSKTRWAPVEVSYREVEFPVGSHLHLLKYKGYRALLSYYRQRPAATWVARAFSRG